MTVLGTFIKINGIYDIICALCILKKVNIPILNNLHLSVMKNYSGDNDLFERFYAYWIFTYGIIRLSNNIELISFSYFIEAIFFINEYTIGTVYKDTVIFIVISCLLLGYASRVYKL
jgi:hypothetical protein